MKKKLLLSLLLGVAGILSAEEVIGTVNTNALNLRMQPGLSSPVVGKVKQNEKLTITGKKGSWLEVAAPESVKVFVDRAYISKGKTITDLTMRSRMDGKSASFGKLPKGTAVKIIGEYAYGWARIQAPANLRVYTASLYVQFDADAVRKLAAEKAAAEKAAAPVEKPAEKAAAPVEKPAEKKAADQVKKPAASVEKPAEKKAAAPEKKAAPAFAQSDLRVAALKKLGIDVFKMPCKEITARGTLVPVPSSVNLATNYAIGTTETPIIGFVCVAEDGMLKPFVNKEVQLLGRQFKVEGWKSPIIWLDEIDMAK